MLRSGGVRSGGVAPTFRTNVPELTTETRCTHADHNQRQNLCHGLRTARPSPSCPRYAASRISAVNEHFLACHRPWTLRRNTTYNLPSSNRKSQVLSETTVRELFASPFHTRSTVRFTVSTGQLIWVPSLIHFRSSSETRARTTSSASCTAAGTAGGMLHWHPSADGASAMKNKEMMLQDPNLKVHLRTVRAVRRSSRRAQRNPCSPFRTGGSQHRGVPRGRASDRPGTLTCCLRPKQTSEVGSEFENHDFSICIQTTACHQLAVCLPATTPRWSRFSLAQLPVD